MGKALLVIAFVGLVLLIGVGILMARSSRSTRQSMARAAARDESALEDRVELAGSRLLEADELARSASDELEFARVQFGISATQAYADAIEAAKGGLLKAFELQQQMNEAPNLAARAALADHVIGTLDAVMPALIQSREHFVKMRDAQAGADEQVGEVRALIDEARGKIPSMQAELEALKVAYPQMSVASLEDNPGQAAALLDSAEKNCDQAASLLATDRAEALRTLDRARRAVSMAGHQIQAVLEAQSDLSQADERLAQAIASITADLADVRTLGADEEAFAPLVKDANAAVDQARQARGGHGDPLAALENLRLAEDALDAALAPLRGQTDARSRQEGSAQRQLEDAVVAIRRARAFVQSRRGLVPLEGRSTLMSAEGALTRARALVNSSPAQSIAASQEAIAQAEKVLNTPVPLVDIDGPGAQYQGPQVGQGAPRRPGDPDIAELGEAIASVVLSGVLSKGRNVNMRDVQRIFDIGRGTWGGRS